MKAHQYSINARSSAVRSFMLSSNDWTLRISYERLKLAIDWVENPYGRADYSLNSDVVATGNFLVYSLVLCRPTYAFLSFRLKVASRRSLLDLTDAHLRGTDSNIVCRILSVYPNDQPFFTVECRQLCLKDCRLIYFFCEKLSVWHCL